MNPAAFLSLNLEAEKTVEWIIQSLESLEFQAIPSFNLRSTQRSRHLPVCDVHGERVCDCQLIILLVYEQDRGPATLLAQGRDGRTWLSFADLPAGGQEAGLVQRIQQALQQGAPAL